jgi:nitric oxide dioxygenase
MSDDPSGLPDDFAHRLTRDCADAIVYADRDGRIRYWNAGAARIFGFDESEALGTSLDLIVPQRLQARHWQGYRAVMAGRESRYGEGALLAVPAMRKDGRQISVEFTILPFNDADGAVIGIAAVLRDVTARFEETRRLQRELATLKGQPGAR